MIVHAGLVALRLDQFWRGVLITGASGAGKSDLALRAIDSGFRLVADDRVVLWMSGGGLYGRAPASLAGLIEARGLGVLAEPALDFSRIALICHCASPEARMPEPERESLIGASLPRIRLSPFEASAPAKLRRALMHLGDCA